MDEFRAKELQFTAESSLTLAGVLRQAQDDYSAAERQSDRIQGLKKSGGIEHYLNTKTGRNVPKNQGVIKVLKERL
jgi:hypothetical protein